MCDPYDHFSILIEQELFGIVDCFLIEQESAVELVFFGILLCFPCFWNARLFFNFVPFFFPFLSRARNGHRDIVCDERKNEEDEQGLLGKEDNQQENAMGLVFFFLFWNPLILFLRTPVD